MLFLLKERKSLLFKPSGFVKFCQNLLNGVLRDHARSENVLIGKTEIFNLVEGDKSFIALNILSLIIGF